MLFLFLSEMSEFLSTQTVTTMFVNPESDAHQLSSRLTINIDIVMPALPCSRRGKFGIVRKFLTSCSCECRRPGRNGKSPFGCRRSFGQIAPQSLWKTQAIRLFEWYESLLRLRINFFIINVGNEDSLSKEGVEKMKGEGCHIHGSMEVKKVSSQHCLAFHLLTTLKVPGNFHIVGHLLFGST